jgi:hypothetical protein
MQTLQEIQSSGIRISAVRANAHGIVSSYIGYRRGRRVYGFFDHKSGKYVEESAPHR